MRRDWSDARLKVTRERSCRVARMGGCEGPIEAAHTIGRRYDGLTTPARVDPDDIVPLCKRHHMEYDGHELDLLPYLTLVEQASAVRHIGIERARRRLAPSQTRGTT